MTDLTDMQLALLGRACANKEHGASIADHQVRDAIALENRHFGFYHPHMHVFYCSRQGRSHYEWHRPTA